MKRASGFLQKVRDLSQLPGSQESVNLGKVFKNLFPVLLTRHPVTMSFFPPGLQPAGLEDRIDRLFLGGLE